MATARALIVTLFAGAVAAISGSARADPAYGQSVELIWRAPTDAQCATAEQMRERVARLTERSFTRSGAATALRIEVAISKPAEVWQADVRMLDGQAQLRARTVRGRAPSCGSLDVATAVVIATMLDSVRVEITNRPETPSADGGGLRLGAFGAVSPELIPKAWIGGGIALETQTAIQLAFSASIYAPRQQLDERRRGAGLWGFHAGLALCPAAARGVFLDLRVCAGAQTGAVLASGVGLSTHTHAAVPILLLHAGPKLTLKVTRSFALQLTASTAWSFVRPKLSWDIEGQPTQTLNGRKIALLAQLGVTISPW